MLIVLWIVAVGTLACLVIAFAPLSIIIRSAGALSVRGVSIRFSWMHPLILEGCVALPDATLDITVLRRFNFRSSSKNAENNKNVDNATAPQPGPVKTKKESSHTQSISPAPRGNFRTNSPTGSEHSNEAASAAAPLHVDSDGKKQPADHQPSVFARIRKLLFGKKVQLVMFFLRQTGLYGKIFRWLGGCLHLAVRLVFVHSYSVSVRAGMDDPAETGRMYGVWMGLRYGLPLPDTSKRRLALEPVFDRQCLEIDGWVRLQSSVARFVGLAIVALVTFPYLSTMFVWRNSRKLTREGGKESEAS